MPSHTIPSALIKLYHAEPGAPWEYPAWKELTGIHHGLFPKDKDKLPPGWTPENAEAVQRYFERYGNLSTEEEKIKFSALRTSSNLETVPGRAHWRIWVHSNSRLWNIQQKITQVLQQEEITPLQIATSEGLDALPDSELYIPCALDQVGVILYGEESLGTNGRLKSCLRDGTKILIQRTWENLKRQLGRSKKRLEKLQAAGLAAIAELDKGDLTKVKTAAAIRAIGKWKNLAQQYEASEMLEEIASLEIRLNELMDSLGGGVRGKGRGKGAAGKASYQLATAEDVEYLTHLYDELFAPSDVCVEPVSSLDNLTFGAPVDGADPGVEVECQMSSSDLAKNLGFSDDCLPTLFNRVRHTAGLNGWDPELHSEFANPNLGAPDSRFEKNRLHWHQLAGIHAIIRNVFSNQPQGARGTGMLLADEVGIGKTLQSLAVVAVLIDLKFRQEKAVDFPPLIRSQPYLAGSNVLPSLPHLIVVPGTLLAQWEQEIKILFRSASVDILPYGSGVTQHEDFWSEGGLYNQSKHEPRNRIIIASHSALLQDFQQLYRSKPASQKHKKSLPWATPPTLPQYERRRPNTLFRQQYLTVVFDEAQIARNPGPKHSSAILLLNQAIVRLVLTATPLQTSTKDIGAMGRLVGIPYFSSNDAFVHQQKDDAELRRTRVGKFGAPTPPGEKDPVQLCQITISQRLQSCFEGRVIRRTPMSLDPNGRPLIDLPPLSIVYAVLNLTARELELIDEVSEDDIEDAAVANGKPITSSTFYLAHRKGVTFSRKDPGAPLPKFKSLEDWNSAKSTKIDTCARLCRHVLERDDAPPVEFKDGEALFPPMPSSSVPYSQKTKVIIYQEFPFFRPILVNILKLYGLDCLWIDGRTPYEKRAETVSKFKTNPDCRILLFSKVGTVGLNLSCANVVIFLDQPWSFQEEIQIRGRAHRQPQDRPVTCYHLLAASTADMVLSSMAKGKRDMLDAFLGTATSRKLLNVLSGESYIESESEGEEPRASVRPGGSKKIHSLGRQKVKEGPSKEEAPQNQHIVAEAKTAEGEKAVVSTDASEPSSRQQLEPSDNSGGSSFVDQMLGGVEIVDYSPRSPSPPETSSTKGAGSTESSLANQILGWVDVAGLSSRSPSPPEMSPAEEAGCEKNRLAMNQFIIDSDGNLEYEGLEVGSKKRARQQTSSSEEEYATHSQKARISTENPGLSRRVAQPPPTHRMKGVLSETVKAGRLARDAGGSNQPPGSRNLSSSKFPSGLNSRAAPNRQQSIFGQPPTEIPKTINPYLQRTTKSLQGKKLREK